MFFCFSYRLYLVFLIFSLSSNLIAYTIFLEFVCFFFCYMNLFQSLSLFFLCYFSHDSHTD